jgi:putative ribosome biogenesis GTPase RsgA
MINEKIFNLQIISKYCIYIKKIKIKTFILIDKFSIIEYQQINFKKYYIYREIMKIGKVFKNDDISLNF